MVPKSTLNNDEAKKELDKLKEIEQIVYKEKLFYKTNKHTYSFKTFQTIRTFGRDICNGNITLKEADEYQVDLLVEIMNFKKKTKQKSPEKTNMKKKLFLKTCISF